MNDSQLQQMLLQVAETPPQKVWEQVDAVLDEDANDRNLKLKLANAELEPPLTAWHKIETGLNLQSEDEQVANRLHNAEEILPDDVWLRIEQKLDDEEWSKQLQAAEVTVPLSTWNVIETKLDHLNEDEQFARLLLQSTQEPPAKIWQAVEEELNNSGQGKVVPMFPKWKPILRFAAAAVVTAAIAWGVYQLMPQSKQPATIAEVKPSDTLPSVTENIQPLTEKKQENNSTALTELPVKQKTKVKRQLTSAQIEANGLTDHITSKSVPVENVHHHKKAVTKNATPGFAEDQYLLVMNNNGDLIRVSKKISNIKCANTTGEIPVDAMAALESRDCSSQIKQWQRKLATSTAISPLSGFIDIKEIISAVEK